MTPGTLWYASSKPQKQPPAKPGASLFLCVCCALNTLQVPQSRVYVSSANYKKLQGPVQTMSRRAVQLCNPYIYESQGAPSYHHAPLHCSSADAQ